MGIRGGWDDGFESSRVTMYVDIYHAGAKKGNTQGPKQRQHFARITTLAIQIPRGTIISSWRATANTNIGSNATHGESCFTSLWNFVSRAVP